MSTSSDHATGFRLSPQQMQVFSRPRGVGVPSSQCQGLLSGVLDEARLEDAMNSVVALHEILRTTFRQVAEPAMYVQVVHEAVRFGIEREESISSLESACKHASQAGQEAITNGDEFLNLRASSIPGQGCLLTLTAHAAVCDALGLRNVLRDLAAAYHARLGVDDEILQYADIAEWAHGLFEDDEAGAGLKYWLREGMEGASLDLPFFSRSNTKCIGSGRLESEPAKVLAAVTEEFGLKLESVFVSCGALLLDELTNQQHLTVGLAFDGRTSEDLEDLPGPFRKVLPLGLDLESPGTLLDFVTSVHRRVVLHENYQEYFDWLRQAGQPIEFPEELDVVFDFIDLAGASTQEPENLEIVDQQTCDLAPHQLGVTVVRRALSLDVLVSRCCGDTSEMAYLDLLAARIVDLLGRFASHLQNPARDVLYDLPWGRLGEDFSGPSLDVPDRTIHGWFQETALLQPDEPAVIGASGTITYGELEARANVVASALVREGVQPNQRIGLCVERSPEMIVGMLGILKAGAGYLPLDPSYPEQRTAFILDDASPPIVVTQRKFQETLKSHGISLLVLDDLRDHDVAQGWAPAEDSESLAYVIYTSGSTGSPKGVEIEHRNLVHSTFARIHHYQGFPHRYLLLSSFAFDSSVAGIFWTLCNGGALVLPGPGEERDPDALVRLIEKHKVSELLALPSLYNLILLVGPPDRLTSLSTIIVAGEECTASIAEQHRDKLPSASLFNEYGPTEASVWCTVWKLGNTIPNKIPIGKPIANTCIHILDRNLIQCPPGILGEICVSGPGVARGYLDRDELTDERFVAPPWSPNTRLYRTGDLGRQRLDGTVLFYGRMDSQVKIRGYRIELGEIDARIAECAGISEAVTLVHTNNGSSNLAAYLASNDANGQIAQTVRQHLMTLLPDYMVPTHFICVDDIPRLPNGKVDRDALPSLSSAHRNVPYVAPINDIEVQIAAMWRAILGVDQVGRIDNFFDLGGNSILAVQAINQINDISKTNVPLGALFEDPTLATVAEYVISGGYEEREMLIPLNQGGTRPPLYCLCGIQIYQDLADHLGDDQPVFGVYIPIDGKLQDDAHDFPTVQQLAATHVGVIQAGQPEGPYCIAGVSFGGVLAFEVARQLRAAGQEIGLLALFDCVLPGCYKIERARWAAAQLKDMASGSIIQKTKRKSKRLAEIALEHLGINVASIVSSSDNGPSIPMKDLRARAYLGAMRDYEEDLPTYGGRVLNFHAQDRPVPEGYYVPVDLGWARAVTGHLENIRVPGDHIGLLTEGHVKEVSARIRSAMDSLRGAGPTEQST